MCKLKYLSIIFLLAACVRGENVNGFGPGNYQEEVVLEEQEPFVMEEITRNFREYFDDDVPGLYLNNYRRNVQKILEHDFDGKIFNFREAGSFSVNFKLKESFKIKEGNIYCREYEQIVMFHKELLEHTGVACRERDGLWRNVKLTAKPVNDKQEKQQINN
jgi:hypothetical protein